MVKKNLGGRPRKHAKPGKVTTHWKKITYPLSTHTYEVSTTGQVRRLKADGTYYDVKPWLNSGNAYLSVYIYGVKRTKRNRKKVYVHRLIADAFVPGKSKGKVVHHTVGPHSNTKNTLQWVSPSENLKARKFFNDDGTRKKRKPNTKNAKSANQNKKGTNIALTATDAERNAELRMKMSAKAPQPLKRLKGKRREKYVPKKQQNKKVEAIDLTKDEKKLPDEIKGYDKSWDWPFSKKLKWLKQNRKDFMKVWAKFRKDNPKVTKNNIVQIYRKVSGKSLQIFIERSPAAKWNSQIRAAMKKITAEYK